MAVRTKPQRWAQERNWNKMRFTSAYYQLINIRDAASATTYESNCIDIALDYLKPVLENWEKSNAPSKARYLKEGK